MPQTGDGDDIERPGRRRGPLGSLEELREELAEERSLPRGERDSDRISQLNNQIRQAERLQEAEGAADTADTAEETVRTLTSGQRGAVTRQVNNYARERFGDANPDNLTSAQRGALTRVRNRLTAERLEN